MKFDNQYLFQTKNPGRLIEFELPQNSVICTTIESNRFYPEIMSNSPRASERVEAMSRIELPKYVTIEPILDFDIDELVEMVKSCKPIQVNIGADSGNHKLPEPSKEMVMNLIETLSGFTTVKLKTNLNRILR